MEVRPVVGRQVSIRISLKKVCLQGILKFWRPIGQVPVLGLGRFPPFSWVNSLDLEQGNNCRGSGKTNAPSSDYTGRGRTDFSERASVRFRPIPDIENYAVRAGGDCQRMRVASVVLYPRPPSVARFGANSAEMPKLANLVRNDTPICIKSYRKRFRLQGGPRRQ